MFISAKVALLPARIVLLLGPSLAFDRQLAAGSAAQRAMLRRRAAAWYLSMRMRETQKRSLGLFANDQDVCMQQQCIHYSRRACQAIGKSWRFSPHPMACSNRLTDKLHHLGWHRALWVFFLISTRRRLRQRSVVRICLCGTGAGK
ncbi:hypothetical protein J3E69DRAFT_312011 [Trichoderma sp. SZMC 28015]